MVKSSHLADGLTDEKPHIMNLITLIHFQMPRIELSRKYFRTSIGLYGYVRLAAHDQLMFEYPTRTKIYLGYLDMGFNHNH